MPEKSKRQEGKAIILRDIRGLPIIKEEHVTVELGRLQYNGNTVKMYIPKKLKDALKLDPQKDNAVILLYDEPNDILLLIRNEKLRDQLKPQILAARNSFNKLLPKSK
jgi:hypothetical protein